MGLYPSKQKQAKPKRYSMRAGMLHIYKFYGEYNAGKEDGESISKYVDVIEKMTIQPKPEEGEKKSRQRFGRREFQERTVTTKVLVRSTCDMCVCEVVESSPNQSRGGKGMRLKRCKRDQIAQHPGDKFVNRSPVVSQGHTVLRIERRGGRAERQRSRKVLWEQCIRDDNGFVAMEVIRSYDSG